MTDALITAEEIRSEVARWLDQNWSPDRSLLEWRNILIDGGWAAPHWPEEYFGRGFTTEQAAVVTDVFHQKAAVPAAQIGPGRQERPAGLSASYPGQRIGWYRLSCKPARRLDRRVGKCCVAPSSF